MIALDYTWPDVETSSDAYARRFSGDAGAYLLKVQNEGLEALLRAGTHPIQSALDVGGGHGQLVESLLRTAGRVTVLGSDDCCAERIARSPLGNQVEFRQGELLAAPFDDRSFDLVTSIRLLAHMTHWHVLIAELCRVSRRHVIVDYPTLMGLNALALPAYPVKRAIEKDTRTYRSFWPSQINRVFARHGFRPAGTFKQFVVPMGLHRMAGTKIAPVESAMRAVGITRMLGNPVLARFDRVAA
ncbi:SAM-dependent methyltransferase [Sphingobium sp. SCG-1]|uniref:class I SAM-dependent methyltransferase n=1 Tax=Sphingobium sp. SCG-1 TaxID=2072936 RepID=UPI000CD6AC9E|nr:class I SAM-dependent methyltransferase [Sphingobium sp. SCG-1]AUW58820.1 SAM-dependent methyltransferase [Sphingobium sp. SCG-1]